MKPHRSYYDGFYRYKIIANGKEKISLQLEPPSSFNVGDVLYDPVTFNETKIIKKDGPIVHEGFVAVLHLDRIV